MQVRYEEELVKAIETATGDKKDCLCFIEVIVHKDDTSKELLEWGSRVSAANSRPPNPQQTTLIQQSKMNYIIPTVLFVTLIPSSYF